MLSFPRWMRHGLVVLVALAWFADFIGTLAFSLPTNTSTQTIFLAVATTVLGIDVVAMRRSQQEQQEEQEAEEVPDEPADQS